MAPRERGGGGASGPSLAVRSRRVGGAPVVAVRVWIRGGARSEEIPGQALVTGRMLAEGSRTRDWKRIAEEAEGRGMAIASFGSYEFHGVAVDALAEDWELALAWAAELVREPAFPEERCAWVTRQAVGEFEALRDEPEVRTAWEFLAHLYAPHPRGRPLHGSAESLRRLLPGDCAAHHRRGLAGRVVVAVAGAVDEDRTRRAAEDLFRRTGAAGEPPAEPPAPEGLPGERRVVALPGGEQAHLYAGHRTVPRRHPDHTALEVAGVILGAGPGLQGRLPRRLREQEGLAYSVQVATVAGAGEDPGRLVVYLGTSPAAVEAAEEGIREEIGRLVEGGISPPELQEAKSYLAGREPLRRETARQWAEVLAAAEFYGIGFDRPEWMAAELGRLDRGAVEEAVRRHIHPAGLRVTVGLPEEGLKPSGSRRPSPPPRRGSSSR